jgi:hypothetical protein
MTGGHVRIPAAFRHQLHFFFHAWKKSPEKAKHT